MVPFQIREYRDEDYETVRDLFATGMSEYVPTLCVHMLKQPWVILLLACTFCLLLTSSRSLLLPILAVTLLLAVGRQLLGYVWSRYIDHCLQEDLLDIQSLLICLGRADWPVISWFLSGSMKLKCSFPRSVQQANARKNVCCLSALLVPQLISAVQT